MSGKDKRGSDFAELSRRLQGRLEEIRAKRPKKKEEMADWVKTVEEGFKELSVAVGFCLAYIETDLAEQTEIFGRSPLGPAKDALANLLGNSANHDGKGLLQHKEVSASVEK